MVDGLKQRGGWVVFTVLCCVFSMSGCEANSSGPGETLVDPHLWEILAPEADPFEDLRSEESECNPLGVTVEGDVLEVQSDVCGFVSLAQPALRSGQAGDLVELLVYHSALWSQEPAQGYLAVLLGDTVFWEQTLEIPGDADVYNVEEALDADLEVGEQIVFHLHNHGANAYKLGHLAKRDN